MAQGLKEPKMAAELEGEQQRRRLPQEEVEVAAVEVVLDEKTHLMILSAAAVVTAQAS